MLIEKALLGVNLLLLDIIGNKQRGLMVYEAFNLGYGNVKTLFKRLNMVGITKEQVLGRLNDGSR